MNSRNRHRRLANKHHDERASITSKHVNRSGIGAGSRRIKAILNRIAKRVEKALAFKDEE